MKNNNIVFVDNNNVAHYINIEPIKDILTATDCNSGKSLSNVIKRIRDNMILAYNPNGHIDFDKIQNDYFVLNILAKAFEEMDIKKGLAFFH
jgi:hypothetical protein